MISRYIMTKAIDFMTSPTRRFEVVSDVAFFLVAGIFLKIATRDTVYTRLVLCFNTRGYRAMICYVLQCQIHTGKKWKICSKELGNYSIGCKMDL